MLVSYEAITAFESTLAERVALVDGYLVVEESCNSERA